MVSEIIRDLERCSEDTHAVVHILFRYHSAGIDRQTLENALTHVGYSRNQIADYMYELGRIS